MAIVNNRKKNDHYMPLPYIKELSEGFESLFKEHKITFQLGCLALKSPTKTNLSVLANISKQVVVSTTCCLLVYLQGTRYCSRMTDKEMNWNVSNSNDPPDPGGIFTDKYQDSNSQISTCITPNLLS
ncbi:hypothetical protein WA026_015299 [Henosepilachna vigintioctopunctata]|uniref:Uncharacterized protein n=1 Tax=Henosepilachna vigintioctopunctata TaxID=420089 RepID=A0AAW1TUI5_9CUCU